MQSVRLIDMTQPPSEFEPELTTRPVPRPGDALPGRNQSNQPADPRTRTETQPFKPAKGEWHDREPIRVFSLLKDAARADWSRLIARALKDDRSAQRGQAIIALALWHKDPAAPYNLTEGQRRFWEVIRASLPDLTPLEAVEQWSDAAPVAAALMRSPERLSEAVQSIWVKSQNLACRHWALEILHLNTAPQALEVGVEALTDMHIEIQLAGARLLADMGDERHVPALLRALNDSTESVRLQAALALASIAQAAVITGQLREDPAFIALVRALLQDRPASAQAAAAALGWLAVDDALDVLIRAAMLRQEPAILREIAAILSKFKHISPRCRAVLLRLSRHTDQRISQSARMAMTG